MKCASTLFFALILCCSHVIAATGDILSVTVRSDGWSADVVVEGFSAGASYAFGLGTNNALTGSETLRLTVTSLGFDSSGNATTIVRTAVGTKAVRKPYPNQAQLDETASGNLTVRIALSDPIFAKDQAGGGNSGTDIIGSAAAGLVTNTAGGGQSSNARPSFTVLNNSTLPYPKVIGRWAWPGFERVTSDFLVEAVCFNQFGRNGRPVACVKFDCVDEVSATAPQQTSTAMTVSPRSTGDANKVWSYSSTIPIATLTDGKVLTCRFRAYPWVGDSGAVLDTDPSADGVAAPSESLGPLMMFLDKSDALACYASVDGVGAGTPAVQTSADLARTTSYANLSAALTGLKAFNSANHSDNSLNNCVVLMQNGTYAGPPTFTGSNTKSLCIIKGDIENGATESGVIVSTATNQACNAYLKFQDVTFSGSASGILRGNQTTGLLWLHSCTLANTGTSYVYQWRVCFATQNTITATSATGFKQFATNRGAFALIRGNNASSITGGMVANVYCVLGNRGIQHGSGFTESGAANDLSENAIVAWNSAYGLSVLYLNEFFATSSSTKGLAIVGNVAEKTSNTNPFGRICGDNANLNDVSNVIIVHNTFAGERMNECYQEGGNQTLLRQNWSDSYNCYRDWNTKTENFANPQRTITDGVLNGTTTLTSASANFTSADLNQIVAAEGLPNGYSSIATVVNSTTVTLTDAATTSATGVTVGIRGYLANANRVGNWAFVYGCGCRGSRNEISNFPREFFGIDVATVGSQSLGYTLDKSMAGAGGGGGDYSLTDVSPARNRVPTGGAMIPGDLNGVAIDNSGFGAAGALQPAPPVVVPTGEQTILNGIKSNILD